MKVSVYEDGVLVGTANKTSSDLPDYLQSVELAEADALLASNMLKKEVKPGKYTLMDGDVFFAALAATYKGSSLNAKLEDDSTFGKIAKMKKITNLLKGGEGSGNFGHSGRPGERGGSSSDGGGDAARTEANAANQRFLDKNPDLRFKPTEDKQQIGRTILEQMGGNQLKAMTGANNFVTTARGGLQFKVPNAAKGINSVSVELHGDDTYAVEFMRIRGGNVKIISSHSGIYADKLRGLFERETKLSTSMTHRYDKGLLKTADLLKGGDGSGNFGHSGRPGEQGGSASGGGSGSSGGKDSKDSSKPKIDPLTHVKLVHILTQDDQRIGRREAKTGRENIYRLGHYFTALKDAEENPKGLAAGIRDAFTPSGLRDRLLRLVEPKV